MSSKPEPTPSISKTKPLPSVFADQSKDQFVTDSKTKFSQSYFKCSDTKRDMIQNKALKKQMQFNDEDEGFVYTSEIAPGAAFYQYLVHPDSDVLPLKLWIPDTIVLVQNEPPRWIYCDAGGYVKETTQFTPRQAAKKFDSDSDKFPSLIERRQILKPRRSNPNHMVTDGSKSSVIDPSTLISILSQPGSIEQNIVFQKFIKCKHNRAIVYRILFHEHQNIRAWMLMNNVGFTDDASDDIKYIIDIKRDDQCKVYPIQGKDVDKLSDVMYDIVRFVSHRIGRTFTELVCDFIQDELGNWWFLQVKSFLLKDGVPTLSGMEKLQNENSLYLMDHSAYLKKSRSEAEALQPFDINIMVDSDDESKNIDYPITANSRKCSDCACCGILYPINQLQYKMTYNMIKELKNNLKIRCADLQSSWTNLTTHVSKKKGDNNLSDTSYLYNPLIICKLCYKVYRSEQKLRSISSELARAMGVPAPLFKAAGDDEGNKAAELGNDPGNELITDIPSQDQINILLVPSTIPKKLMMCRFLVILHTIYDFPEELINIKDKRLLLRLKMLNLQIDLPIDPFVASQVQFRTAKKENQTGEGSTTQLVSDDQIISLPVNYMRLFYILANGTSKNGTLPDGSGLAKFIQNPHLTPTISLLWEGSNTVISESKFKLDQFKSDVINKMDQYLLFNVGNYTPQLHISVGLERTGDYNAAHLRTRLQQIDSDIYVPPSNYFSSDPVPPEWVMELPYAGLSCLDPDHAMGIWKYVGVDMPEPMEEEEIKEEEKLSASIKKFNGPSESDFAPVRRSASPAPNSGGRKHKTKLGISTPVPTSLSVEDGSSSSGAKTPGPHTDASVSELATTVEKREKWPNSIWCMTINCSSARNIPETVVIPPPENIPPPQEQSPYPNQQPGVPPTINQTSTNPAPTNQTITNSQQTNPQQTIPPPTNEDDVQITTIHQTPKPTSEIKPLNEFPSPDPYCVKSNNPNLKETPTINLNYEIMDITYDLKGYPTEPNEVGFKYIHKHYIQGSIDSLSRFFHEIPTLKFKLGYLDNTPIDQYECKVDWSLLAEHRCIDGTFDFSVGDVVKPLPSQSYPPYISLAISIYRCGPLSEKSQLPFGLSPWRQYEDITLLYKTVPEEDRATTPQVKEDVNMNKTCEIVIEDGDGQQPVGQVPPEEPPQQQPPPPEQPQKGKSKK